MFKSILAPPMQPVRLSGLACALLAILPAQGLLAGDAKAPVPQVQEAAVSWKTNTIAPVSDPIYFEDAQIRSEVRPVFGFQNIHDEFITGGGDIQIYGVQLRYAVTDRLALIAVKGGYMEVNPEYGPKTSGWTDVTVGAKYALIDDEASQFILTPGVTYELPIGEKGDYQGVGDGIFNVFVSSQKGFGDFHLQSTIGLTLPVDRDVKTSVLHYHVQADYFLNKWFIPFVFGHGYTTVSEGKNLPLASEGYDLVNFGSTSAKDVTQVSVGAGFRTRITDQIDFGFAYQKAVAKPEGLLDDRYTVDFVIRF